MDPSWNSSPRLVDLTSYSAPLELVERLRPAWLITSELPERRKLWHVTEQLTRTPLVLPNDRFSARYSYPRWPLFYIFSADFPTDCYRVCDHHNVVLKHSSLPTVLSVSNLSIPLDLSRDVSDVPISLFLANIRLQCEQCEYRPSYRCQQLRWNYIKYNYTLLRQPVLYLAYTCYNGWAIYYFTVALAYVVWKLMLKHTLEPRYNAVIRHRCPYRVISRTALYWNERSVYSQGQALVASPTHPSPPVCVTLPAGSVTYCFTVLWESSK